MEWRLDAPRKAPSRNGNQPHVLVMVRGLTFK
ncbi:hypothetical protein ACVWXS_000067 [Lysinibacillus sp. TE18511]